MKKLLLVAIAGLILLSGCVDTVRIERMDADLSNHATRLRTLEEKANFASPEFPKFIGFVCENNIATINLPSGQTVQGNFKNMQFYYGFAYTEKDSNRMALDNAYSFNFLTDNDTGQQLFSNATYSTFIVITAENCIRIN